MSMVESLILNFLSINSLINEINTEMVYKTNERGFIVNIFKKTKSHLSVRSETPEMLINTSDNMIKRVKACLECDGKHFQHLA